jgi:hypothetical protein
VCLNGLTFLGPSLSFEGETADYTVRVEIFHPVKKRIFPEADYRNRLMKLCTVVTGVQKRTTFEVNFPETAQIQSGRWHLIQIMLDVSSMNLSYTYKYIYFLLDAFHA